MSKTISESVADPRPDTKKLEKKLRNLDYLAKRWADESLAELARELKALKS